MTARTDLTKEDKEPLRIHAWCHEIIEGVGGMVLWQRAEVVEESIRRALKGGDGGE